MVRVANIVLRRRGGASTKEADDTPVKGADLKGTAIPALTLTPVEPQTTQGTATEAPVEAPAKASPAAETEETPAEPETTGQTTKVRHSGRRGSAGRAAKKGARQTERAEKKEVRQEKRQAKKDARKGAKAAAALGKKEKAEAVPTAVASDNSEGENSEPERATLLRRVSQLLGWGSKGAEKKEGEEEEAKTEETEAEEDEEDEEDVASMFDEAAEDTTQEIQAGEAGDELYVVNDIPIRMTVVEPQPIIAAS